MQPFIPPSIVRLLHEDMVQAELHRREMRANRNGAGLLVVLREQAGRLLIALGTRSAPNPRKDVQPAVPIILHDGRRRIGELEVETRSRRAV